MKGLSRDADQGRGRANDCWESMIETVGKSVSVRLGLRLKSGIGCQKKSTIKPVKKFTDN
jgi:hypothetical protein